jgi:hypothetical protein
MRFNRSSAAIAAAVVVSAVVWLSAQTSFQFFVSAVDADGKPVTDLRPEDVLMSENGVQQQIVKVEPLAVPMKLTIAVDNGLDSSEALAHYRSGLTGLVEALPPDVEITLITTAPQPRTVVKPTTDRRQILRGVNGFAPEQARPRFSDALVEYSERLQFEAKDRKAAPYLPVLLMVSTAAIETRSYQPKDIEKAVAFLAARHAKVNSIVVSTRPGDTATAAGLDLTLQSIVAIPTAKATNGRYEGLAVSNRLATLLPEWGRDLAALHARQIKQFRVTVERSRGGELQSPRIEIARPGLSGTVTVDGYLP